MLFETLSRSPSLVTIGGESHGVIEGFRLLHPAAHGWHSNRLAAEHATPEIVATLAGRFAARLPDTAQGQRLLEKTPKNSLRVPFLAHSFPQATFLFLHRDPRQTLSSMIEAWQSGRFRTYPRMPGWDGMPWSLLLVPGWRELAGLPLPEIVAHQWARTMDTLLDDLEALPQNRLLAVQYEAFIADPQEQSLRLAQAIGITWGSGSGEKLALSSHTVTRPDPGKWRRHEKEIASVWPIVERAAARAEAFAQRHLPTG